MRMCVGVVFILLGVCVVRVTNAHGFDEYPETNQRQTAERPQDGGLVNDKNVKIVQFLMPGAHPDMDDEYICTSYKVEGSQDQYITAYEALARADTAHHMILFGCDVPAQKSSSWKCGPTCGGKMGSKIMYAWARNAPPTKMPPDVGFHVSGNSGVKWLVLQIHYLHAFPEGKPGDRSGIRITINPKRQKYIGGVYLLYSNYFHIPKNTPKASTDISCKYEGSTDLYPFAFRVHTHTLGKVVSGYVYNGTWYMLGKGNPQWPQAFYPMENKNVIKPGNYVAGQCTYDSSQRGRDTFIGSTHNDEMCNFYMMYYTSSEGGNTYYGCGKNEIPSLEIPVGSDVPLPPNPALDEVAEGHIHSDPVFVPPRGCRGICIEPHPLPDTATANGSLSNDYNFPTAGASDINVVADWPNKVTLGQVAGVAVDSKGNVYVFHRGPVIWEGRDFDETGHYRNVKAGPIKESTILVFDSKGKIVEKWGENMFYMPHGLHIDHDDNVWVTDVALHQVMKFAAGDRTKPRLTLGQRLEPGQQDNQFCKPTDVAVATNGQFYITDGYCNSRVMKFSPEGKLITKWGTRSSSVEADGYPPPGSFSLPHSVSLMEDKNTLCVADRENSRIQCFDLNGKFIRQIHPAMVRSPIYAVSYCPNRDVLYAVNGESSYGDNKEMLGFTVNTTGALLETWNPPFPGFSKPHDVAVSPSGQFIYVTEIGPNKIWKFELNSNIISRLNLHQTVKKGGVTRVSPPEGGVKGAAEGVIVASRPKGSVDSPGDEGAEEEIEEEGGELGPSLVIGALLVIPVIVIVGVTMFLRLRKSGKLKFLSSEFSYKRNRRFNLGNFFSGHKGFERLDTEESDHELDHCLSDSEVEEYSATSDHKA